MVCRKKTMMALMIAALVTSVAGLAFGEIVDKLENADLFEGWATNDEPANTVKVNGDGTVTLLRKVDDPAADSGVNWHAKKPIPLTPENDKVILLPRKASNPGDGYAIAIHYLDENGQEMDNNEWAFLSFSSSTKKQVILNIASHAPAEAKSYYIKFRILPFEHKEAGFTFGMITVTSSK